jgi:tetratricopeptide (TPR) repeat protein
MADMTFNQQHQKIYKQINIGNVTLNLHTTENVAGMLGKAVRLLQTGHYDEALKLLDKVLIADEEVADAYYYHGLALLKGRRPKSAFKSEADKIVRDIYAALGLDDQQAHYYYLLALVLYDFYVMNGFSVKPNEIESLLYEAENKVIDNPKCEELLQHANAPDSPITNILKQRL